MRVPAALCGLAGYRASIELAHERGLWRGGVHLSQAFDTLGWLFRDLSDGPLLASALFGLQFPPADASHAAGAARRICIGVVAPEFVNDAEAVVMQDFAHWTERLRDGGAEFFTFDSSWWREAWGIYAPIQGNEAAKIRCGYRRRLFLFRATHCRAACPRQAVAARTGLRLRLSA